MPRQNTVIEVFVSSPSDVQKERELLETVIDELNDSLSKVFNVSFDLLMWEKDVRPSFGTDPQSVINQQIGDNYDVYIGILWGRFGTPTPRGFSGTEEEFERAYKRLDDENPPEIMFYFKDAPIAPSKIDVDQLKLVQEFKKTISSRGGIYSPFENDESFQSSLRTHLIAIAQKFSAPQNYSKNVDKGTDDKSDFIESDIDDEDLGYLDYIEMYETRMHDFNATMTTITEATERIGEQFSLRTKEVEKFSNQNVSVKKARLIVKKAADDLVAFEINLRAHAKTTLNISNNYNISMVC